MNRRKVVLVGLVYVLALGGLLAAAGAILGLWTGAKQAEPGPAQVASGGLPRGDIPTIRPIWPAEGAATSTGGRSTRTPTPAPTRPAPTQTPTTLGQVALPAATASPPAPVTATASKPATAASTVSVPGGTVTAAAAAGARTATSGPAGQATARPTSSATTAAPTPTKVPPTATPPPPTATPVPSETASPVPPTALPTATETPIPTDIPGGTITGQVLIKGTPAAAITITLETATYEPIATTLSTAEGTYVFADVPDLADGYNVAFSQETNPQLQAQIDRYVTWAWVGPMLVTDGQVQVPAFDIALQDKTGQQWKPTSPAADEIIETVNAVKPILFQWPEMKAGAQYWLDIKRGQNLDDEAWQSPLLGQNRATWDGVNAQGAPQKGDFWWAVGARWRLEPYDYTVYGYFQRFTIKQ